MRRSLYPDGINVDRTVLEYTELSKIEEILRNRVDWTSRGVFSGGAVTVGAVDNTRVDVAAFSGFVPSGEFVECTGSVLSIQLDSSVLNAVNYVCAFYTEAQSRAQTHETDGQTYATRATGSYRVRVYEESNFLALPSTDANLANDARDRALLLAKVTGNGGGALTNSNITSPTEFSSILTATPTNLPNISGVQIVGVSPNLTTGAATIDYTIVGLNKQLTLTSGAGAGATQTITSDGYVDLPDAVSEYVRVYIVYSQLPTTTPVSDAITITDLYSQDIPRLTAEDRLHRNYTGTGIPTELNIHGLSMDDLSGSDFSLLQEHRDQQHSLGLWPGTSAAALSCSISFPVTADMLNIVNLSGQDVAYINGEKVQTASPLNFSFDVGTIPTSASGSHLYEVWLSDQETTAVALKMSHPDPRNITGCWIVDASEDFPVGVGSFTLTLAVTNPGVITFNLNIGGEPAEITAADDPQIIRLFAENAVDWVDVWFNCAGGEANPDANPPVVPGAYADTITVYASLDIEQNMQIASITSWYDITAAPPRCAAGFPGYSITRNIIDKRKWGTLSSNNISDSALRELVYNPLDELHYSGVLYSRNAVHDNFEVYNQVALTFSIRGGSAICRGVPIEFAGDTGVTVLDNKVSLVYLDTAGTIDQLNVTDDYAGSMEDALAYLLGGSRLLPETHLSQGGERGCALYRVDTAGGAITATVNIMRNLNGPIPDWSVAAFTGSSIPVSQFDSLYSCFTYINATVPEGTDIEVRLTGQSTISEGITQPRGVSVRSTYQITSFNILITDIDATGSWKLNRGCVIDGVSISQQGEGGAAIELASNCIVSNCTYAQAVANADVFCISANALTDVVVSQNTISTRSGACVLNNAGNSNISVRDNIITQSANNSGFGYGVIGVTGDNLHIGNNILITDNSTDFTSGILIGSGSSNFYISKNTIQIGDGSGMAYEYGISILDGTTNSCVSENIITRVTGSASELGIGVGFFCGSDFQIVQNLISSLGTAIRVYDGPGSSTITNGRICQNSISSCYHRGISIDLGAANTPTVHGLAIDNNRIHSCTKGVGGLGAWGTGLYGIRYDIDVPGAGPYTTVTEGVSITNNTLYNLLNAAASVYGIQYTHSANVIDAVSVYSLAIEQNHISTFLGADGFSSFGVALYCLNADTASSCTISGNTISMQSNCVNPASFIDGIFITFSATITVNSNNVDMRGTTTATLGNGIFTTLCNGTFVGNVISANWIGLYIGGQKSTAVGNKISVNGAGIISEYDALISDNVISVVAVNAVTNSVQPNDSCGGIISGGSDAAIIGNTIYLSGNAGDVPNETAHIYVHGSGVRVQNNHTSLAAVITTVAGVAPNFLTRRAYHIYYGAGVGGGVEISSNNIDNRTNANNALNGLYLGDLLGAGNLHISVKNNIIRGKAADGAVIPCDPIVPVFDYPLEYANLIITNAGDHRWVFCQNNSVTAEDEPVLGGNVPNIYYAAPTTQMPAPAGLAALTNYATNHAGAVGPWW